MDSLMSVFRRQGKILWFKDICKQLNSSMGSSWNLKEEIVQQFVTLVPDLLQVLNYSWIFHRFLFQIYIFFLNLHVFLARLYMYSIFCQVKRWGDDDELMLQPQPFGCALEPKEIRVRRELFRTKIDDFLMRNGHVNVPLTSLPEVQEKKESKWQELNSKRQNVDKDKLEKMQVQFTDSAAQSKNSLLRAVAKRNEGRQVLLIQANLVCAEQERVDLLNSVLHLQQLLQKNNKTTENKI